jgi:hypothetical protein
MVYQFSVSTDAARIYFNLHVHDSNPERGGATGGDRINYRFVVAKYNLK